ncbi:MAG TPA: radical SAM protein [Eggerthellaceae bacterium]|nr:radical SAM protein [Eggerthellaceae bacterium]
MKNKVLQSEIREYRKGGFAYINALKEKGIVFTKAGENQARIDALRDELRERGARFKNAGASIVWGWQSKACVECTGNKGSETFSTTFKCHRDCYFCFNYNVADYDKFVREGCPWRDGLEDAERRYGHDNLAVLGLTGGEPLLVLDDSIALLEEARKRFPSAHKRMYTSGDLLTEEGAARLRDAGLDEIRFSVKQDDPMERQERVLAAMEIAKRYIPSLMVEMPIIPNTDERMHELFERWAAIGIDGINLLEFCFPFHSWEEYAARGFEIRNPPFDVMYDYGYSGGLPVAGSEELCLELMLWGIDHDMPFGMHYCSLDNKHRSEMRIRNERGARLTPILSFDDGDFFLKCGKVYGNDRATAYDALVAAGCSDFMPNDVEQSIAFPLSFLPFLKDLDIELAVAFNVLESDEQGSYIREVAIQPIG